MGKYSFSDFQDQRRADRRPKPKPVVLKKRACPKDRVKNEKDPLKKLLLKCIYHFNAFIRNRDKDKGCISCGKPVTQAGHFYSAGKFNILRFDEDNCHGQCQQCNFYKEGNLKVYRENLIVRIGERRVKLLDQTAQDNRLFKWEYEDLKQIFEKYKKS